MCFYKTEESKVLVAKRDIKVCKIGTYADETVFKPFFYNAFKYPINRLVSEKVVFGDKIERGLHSYLNCTIKPATLDTMDVYTIGYFQYSLPLSYTIFLGEFIIPKGATYCLNGVGEVVSDSLIYTGNYVKVHSWKKYNTRELWKEKWVKYLPITASSIKP